MNIFSNFNLFDKRINQVIKSEKKLTELFEELDTVQGQMVNDQQSIERTEKQLNELNTQNSNLPANNITTSEKHKQLKWRKWFIVVMDAILSFAALNVFFQETVNWSLAPFPALILGLMVAFMLLKLAISFRHYDSENLTEKDNPVSRFWKMYSYLGPLLLIPFLSLYLVINSPNNPANILWVFFLVLCFILNLKVASYSKEYVEMELVEAKRQAEKNLKVAIESSNQSIKKSQGRLQEVTAAIRREARYFWRVYQSFNEDEKPNLSLLIPYRFVLNVKVYFLDVLPIPALVISNPPVGSEINKFCTMWDMAIGASQQPDRRNLPEFINNQPLVREEGNITGEGVYSNPIKNNTSDNTFGREVSDNEKFI